MQTKVIKATTIEDSWYQLIYGILTEGKTYVVNKGSYEKIKRLEYDFVVVHILKPEIRPLIPQIPSNYGLPPLASEEYLNDYMTYLMSPEIKPKEEYTYGQRLTGYITKDNKIINQVDYLINCINVYGHGSNQYILQIAEPGDILSNDPPCLRSIKIKIENNRLNFIVYFRSNDLYNGYPVNLSSIQIMKEYISMCTGLEPGETIYISDGVHLYDFNIEMAKILRGK